MAGFENDILYGSNVDFRGVEPVVAQVTANGQLLIGATASPNIRVGALASAGGTIIITTGAGTIDLATSGSAVGNTITGDSGGALSPTAGNWNILGQQAGTLAVMDTIGSGSTLSIEDRTWITSFVVDQSATVGLRGTFTTIQAAITAASSGQNIFIRPGTYTEDLTLKDGVNLIGMSNSYSAVAPVIIRGKSTFTTGIASIDNISFVTNSDYISAISGSALLSYYRCYFNILTTGAFNLNSGRVNLVQCGSVSASGSTSMFTAINASTVSVFGSTLIGSSTTASTFANTSSITVRNSTLQDSITTSNTAVFEAHNSSFGRTSSAVNGLTHNSTASGCLAFNCEFLSPGDTYNISIGTGATLTLANCTIHTDLASGLAITGLGTLKYTGLSFAQTASTIDTTTQVPLVTSNDALKIKSPAAYPYTTVPQDAVILVDTSSARTITPLASPTTGQKHIIKDNVGSAAANNITITPSGKNIDGAASSTININYGSVTIVYGGSEWHIV